MQIVTASIAPKIPRVEILHYLGRVLEDADQHVYCSQFVNSRHFFPTALFRILMTSAIFLPLNTTEFSTHMSVVASLYPKTVLYPVF